MKAVVYHADARFAWGDKVGDAYKKLFPWFKAQCHNFGFDEVIHLTLEGHPGWGDTNIFYKGYKPEEVMYNREMIFAEFLESAPDDIYWFGEPDTKFIEKFPPLEHDCALLYRHGGGPSICPAWRMFKQKAHPIMRELANLVEGVEIRPGVGRDWHCDSASFQLFYASMGKPKRCGVYRHNGFDIELRPYHEYIKIGKYSVNYKGKSKFQLLEKL